MNYSIIDKRGVSQQAEKWDQRFAALQCADAEACKVLVDYNHLLPNQGRALDLASGLGGNAIYLARAGLEVSAIDLSSIAMTKLSNYAEQQQLVINCSCRDLEQQLETLATDRHSQFGESVFDVIVVSHYLYRSLMPSLLQALRPQGLLFYQTFTQRCIDSSGPSSARYRLARNELLALCEGLHILLYREEGLQGDTEQGFRNQAMIIAQRPSSALVTASISGTKA